MVAVGEQQPCRGLEDNHGRQGVEDPGVALHARGVQVSLGIDRRGGEKVGYPQARHRTIVAARLRVRNPPIHSGARKDDSANYFACTEFSEVDIPALCVAPSLCSRLSYVETEDS